MSSSSISSLYKCLVLPPGDHKDLFELQAIRMVLLHNCIIRSINSIIAQAPEIEPARLQAFMTYCLCCYGAIHHHHANEEELYFIMLEEKMGAKAMGGNVDGHEEFKQPFATWVELCKSIKEGRAPWNPEEFVTATRAFADVLVHHLQDEIETLSADQMRKYFSQEDMRLIESKMDQKIKSEMNIMWDAPMAFINNDAVTGGWFPPMPAPIKFIVRYFIMPWHSDVWAFGASDKHLRVKPRYLQAEASFKPQ